MSGMRQRQITQLPSTPNIDRVFGFSERNKTSAGVQARPGPKFREMPEQEGNEFWLSACETIGSIRLSTAIISLTVLAAIWRRMRRP